MENITYSDKSKGDKFTAEDANELKNVINNLVSSVAIKKVDFDGQLEMTINHGLGRPVLFETFNSDGHKWLVDVTESEDFMSLTIAANKPLHGYIIYV